MAAKNLAIAGAIYPNVPSVNFPVSGGGSASYVETSDATATADKIVQGYTAYVNGQLVTGTASGAGAVVVTEYPDTNGGTVKEITAVDISADTVDAAHLLSGYTAHDSSGNSITGTYVPPTTSLQTKSKTYTPSASSQSERVSADNGYDGLSYVDVSIGAATLQNKTVSYTPSSSQQTATITPDNGYYGLSSVGITVGAAPAPDLQSKSATYTPTGSVQTETITPDTGYDGLSSVSITVNAAASTSKNVQIAAGIDRVATTSYSYVSGQSITVAKTGIYDVYWIGFRSSLASGTNGSLLFVEGTAYGGEKTTFTNLGQSIHLSNVSLTEGQNIQLAARSRSSSSYMYAGNLTIIEA